MKRRTVVWLIVAFLFVALNAVAYRHAWRMTHFATAGARTKSPQELSVLGKIGVLVRGVEIPKPMNRPPPAGAQTVHFTARDGVRLEAWDIPTTDARGVVVMFHGYAVARSAMLGEARVWRDLGWRTVLVDHRGSGGSDGSVTTLGWREAADVAAAVTAVREKPVVVYGQSMGAVAALRAVATEGLQPDGLVLECAFDTLLNTVGHRYHAMGLPAFPFAQLLVFWGGVQHGFNGFAHRPVTYARAVRCPALVLEGEHDPWVKPAEARRLAAALGGLTQCYIFQNGGHTAFVRAVPEEYRRVVSEWLAVNQKTGSGK